MIIVLDLNPYSGCIRFTMDKKLHWYSKKPCIIVKTKITQQRYENFWLSSKKQPPWRLDFYLSQFSYQLIDWDSVFAQQLKLRIE
mmetsp:Transcript_25624/g.40309  ORF Transcript_25624/g.40309 Transcript_25624/m.40309 type:complete len:85 (+) Transcript_25624:401-655(+)